MLAEVAGSIRMKVQDDAKLRAQRGARSRRKPSAHRARHVAARARGGKLILFGNGGSATDANDWAIDCVCPPEGYAPIPAMSLSHGAGQHHGDRQRRRNGRDLSPPTDRAGAPGDVAIGISTSGGSRNIMMALEEARKRKLTDGRAAGLRRRRDPAPRAWRISPDCAFRLYSAHSGSAGFHLPHRAGRDGRPANCSPVRLDIIVGCLNVRAWWW